MPNRPIEIAKLKRQVSKLKHQLADLVDEDTEVKAHNRKQQPEIYDPESPLLRARKVVKKGYMRHI